jgi:hypothetical protein
MKSDPTLREIEEFVDAIPPPHQGLRARVMQSLPPDTRPERGPRLMGAVAVALAVLVVATLVIGVRSLSHAPRPDGVPAATPTAGLPERTPVIPFLDESAAPRVEAVTWSGGRPGVLGVPSRPYAGAENVSPDGSRFLVETTVYDRRGASLGDVTGPIGWRWADDSRHLCGMRLTLSTGTPTTAVNGPATLVVTQPGQAVRDVAPVGRLDVASMARLLACSFATDTAVVVQETAGEYVTETWTVRLSTGATLSHHTYTKGSAVDLVSASADGTLLVEWRPVIPAGSAPVTGTILRAADRTVLGTVHGWVLAFSADDQLAVVAAGLGNEVSVVRWRTGETLWTAPAAQSVHPVIVEPGGARVAVWVSVSADGPMDLWIIGPDGGRKVLTGIKGLA